MASRREPGARTVRRMSAPALIFTVDTQPSPLGRMLVVSDSEQRLRALDWEDHEERMRRGLARIYGRGTVVYERGVVPATTRHALQSYFAGKLQAIDEIPVQTGGTPFQSNVWRALRRIPAGTTLSYGRLAQRLP